MNKKHLTMIIILLFVFSLSNNQLGLTDSGQDRSYWPTQEWQHSTFEETGMNENRIVEMFEYIDENH
ncbi:MAG: hypothetical protein ACTSYH_07470, partial [Candidatus Heimdallarchaeaceae archaeon]